MSVIRRRVSSIVRWKLLIVALAVTVACLVQVPGWVYAAALAVAVAVLGILAVGFVVLMSARYFWYELRPRLRAWLSAEDVD